MSDQREILAQWSQSQGNLRRFLEERVMPPLDDDAQRGRRGEPRGQREREHVDDGGKVGALAAAQVLVVDEQLGLAAQPVHPSGEGERAGAPPEVLDPFRPRAIAPALPRLAGSSAERPGQARPQEPMPSTVVPKFQI